MWGASAGGQNGDEVERQGGCLARECAEPTVANVPDELADIRAWVPTDRPIIAGFYGSGHSSLGSPSAKYVREILPVLLSQPRVDGLFVFTMLAPCGGHGRDRMPADPVCTDDYRNDTSNWYQRVGGGRWRGAMGLCEKGCAIRDAFALASGAGV